jgi:hypothetical protein
MEETYKAEVECLRKVLAEKDKYIFKLLEEIKRLNEIIDDKVQLD